MVDAIRRAAAARHRDEAGVFTAMVAVLATALFLLVGVVVDGGRAIAAHEQATAEGEQAARAGADALSRPSLHTGPIVPDASAGVAAAEAYMVQAGHPGITSVSGNMVNVRVSSYPVPTTLMGLLGFSALSVGGQGSAQAVTRYGR
ncbi:MAG: hypothetical protein DLM54_00425 [Acidimicrobiales bacterium]|nr:MAG: hypothetical protein DLM54_00425 [Acidimicrobiales bacterium]